ncbi:hypothetical protein OC842_001359 [Tilletia horrida]|uniref:LAG1-DNAbind-domain-containing protein n=1 Tax=Tilletia horrida TaxID=155126 RepID=A0AAN6JNI6_9BASI|nr:hypothetical protein OC842_001359 [Tilletia horrida]
MSGSQGNSSSVTGNSQHEPSLPSDLSSSMPPSGSQDATFIQVFPDMDQNLLLGTLGSGESMNPSFAQEHGASTSLYLPSDFQPQSHLDPNFSSTNHSFSQPSSQHFQHAFSSQLQESQHQPQQSSQQHPQQSQPNSQQLSNEYLPQLLSAPQNSHLQQHQQQTSQLPPPIQQEGQMHGPHSISRLDASTQLPFQAAAPGAFSVPAGLFANQYPGLFYGAPSSGSQSTLADTSFDSFMFNSQEQSFSSLTSHTSQSVPGSQDSRLGAVGSNSSLKDSFADASTMPPPSHPANGARRRSSANASAQGSMLGFHGNGQPKQENADSMANVDTPPQQTSFDTTIAVDGQDETQTTPQSNAIQGSQSQVSQGRDGSIGIEDQSPSRQVAAAAGVCANRGFADASESPAQNTNARADPMAAASSHQFLSPPSQTFSQQAPQTHLQPPSSQWQGQGWIPAGNMMGFDAAPFTGSLIQPPPLSASPVTTQGSGLSPTGSSRSTFDSNTLAVDRRGRSSTISVTPELHVPHGDTRPRSSTGSAGSNVHSFTPPAPHSTGMSRTNSSVSLAVFQPLEQLHISGGRPGTAGSAHGSIGSQNSGQFNFQRPGSGGFPTVPQFGAAPGNAVAPGSHGVYGHFGAVGPQQAMTGRFQRTDSFNQVGVPNTMSGSEAMISPTAWQAPNRMGFNPAGGNAVAGAAAGPGGRKMGKLRRAPSNLTLDSNYSSNLSTTSFSPVSYGLPSANTSDASPQFESFPSVPSSATSSNALTTGSMPDFGQHQHAHQLFPVHLGAHFGSQGFGGADGSGGMSYGGSGVSDPSQLGLGAPPSSSLSNKAPGSGYQTPTIMEEDESRMTQSVLSMGLMPAQLAPTMTSANVTPSMPSGGWSHGMILDSVLADGSAGGTQPSTTPLATPAETVPGHMYGPASAAEQSAASLAPESGCGRSSSNGASASASPSSSSAQRSGPSVIVRYGGLRADSADTATGASPTCLELQPSTLHHAVPISMASKYGPSGVPPALSSSFQQWSEYKSYLRDQVCEYLATPSRLGLGERTITIMTAKVGPKSYGTEKRFLCPPPLVMLSGSSWWTADPNKLLTPATDSDGSDKVDAPTRRSRMALLAPPTVSVKMLSESNTCEGGLQWASSDGRLVESKDGLKNKIPIAGRCLARQIYISEASDDKRKPVYATVSISMPGPEKPIELGTFSSGPIKVISKAFRKRQGVRNTDLSILHGSTVSLFHRLKSQTLSTRFLCVSGPPTWIKGSDGRPFLKSSIANPQTPAVDQNASFIVKTASWDSFVIYAVDPSISSEEASQQAPLNPRFPPPPASARPLRVDGESSVPILYNQPVVLQCINTGVTSPIMTIRAVESNKVAVGGLPTGARAQQTGYVPEAAGEPVSHNHRIALEILDENGENAVEPLVENNPACTPGRSGQFLACLQDAVGLRLCGPRKWLPQPPPADSITDADQPKSATPMLGSGSTTTQAAFIAAVAAAQTRNSLAQSRAGNGAPPPTTSVPASSSATFERPDSSDGGKVKRPRRVSSSAVVPKDRSSGPGRGRRRGQSLSTVGLGLHDPVEPHLRTSASSTNLRSAAGSNEAPSVAVGPGCRWMIDVAESDIWSIIGTEQAHHTFYIPPAIQNGYLPPTVDLGPELSHLVRTPTPSQAISPLPVLTNWSFSTTAHLGAGFEPGRETIELHGESLSKNYFVFFGDWESEVIDATAWRMICSPPPMWDESGVPRTELPVTLVREDGIIIPTSLTLALKPSVKIESGSSSFGSFHMGGQPFVAQGAPGSHTRLGGVPSGSRGSSSGSGGPN